jgi:chaperonin GroEL
MQISSHNTNEFSGDSTTTSTIMTHSIQKEGLKYLNAGFNPVLMKRGIEKASKEIVRYLEDTKYEFDYKDEVRIDN